MEVPVATARLAGIRGRVARRDLSTDNPPGHGVDQRLRVILAVPPVSGYPLKVYVIVSVVGIRPNSLSTVVPVALSLMIGSRRWALAWRGGDDRTT